MLRPSLVGLDAYMPQYLRTKRRPEPMLEFAIGRIRRNVPKHRTKASFIQFDSGQFLHHQGRMTGLYDFEVSMIGDPMVDIATMRMCDSCEPLGIDLSRACKHYAELSGEPVDHGVVDFPRCIDVLNKLEDSRKASAAQLIEWLVRGDALGAEMRARDGAVLIDVDTAALGGWDVLGAHWLGVEFPGLIGLADEVARFGTSEDAAALQEASAGGFGVVLDLVCGQPMLNALKATRFGARIMTIGTGQRPPADRQAIWRRLLSIAKEPKIVVDYADHVFDRAGEAWAAQAAEPNAKVTARGRG